MLKTNFVPLAEKFRQLKQSVSEWIVSLDAKQWETQKRVEQLEFRIKELEDRLR